MEDSCGDSASLRIPSTRCSVINHFKQNFELSGFGSPGEALVVSSYRDPRVFFCEATPRGNNAVMWRQGIQLGANRMGVIPQEDPRFGFSQQQKSCLLMLACPECSI